MTVPAPQHQWVAHARDTGWSCSGPSTDVLAFHRSLSEYEPTPLVDLPDLARELGIGRLVAKDESWRLGLPAFKALGASWAIHRALQGRSGTERLTIVTATDGNHGRAVARFARILGHSASIFIPFGVHPAAITAIAGEGALVTMVEGSYDDAVAAAALAARAQDSLLVQDTAWDGYEQIPGWIVDGYATLFSEIDDQLRATGGQSPDLVIVPAGVGSLLQAALSHYRSKAIPGATAIISVEPEVAACVLASLASGEPVTVETGQTILSGLNCGTPSSLAWPYVIGGLDGAVAVTDFAASAAAGDLAERGVASGPCGGAGLAGLRRTLVGSGNGDRRAHLHIGPESTVVMLITEGSAANPGTIDDALDGAGGSEAR